MRSNPPVATAMEDFIRQVLGSGTDEAVYEERSLVNLLEGFLDDQIAMMDDDEEEEEEEEEGEADEVQLALAQDQVSKPKISAVNSNFSVATSISCEVTGKE